MMVFLTLLLSWQLQAQTQINSLSAQWLQKQYITQKEAADHSEDYTEVAFSWNLNKQLNTWDLGVDTQVFYSVGKSNELYIHLREAYASYLLIDNQKLDFGRVKKPWSRIDDVWALGLWEPALKSDGFHFSREGMAGLFYNLQGEKAYLTLFASPLFLPDQGPQVQVKKGQLISSNRWFNNRVSSVKIGEIISPIVYNLHTPEVQKVIQQNAWALDMGLGNPSKGWSAHVAYADKAINQLFVGVRPVHKVSLNNVNRESEIHLYPQVHRHRLLTGELSYSVGKTSLWTSLNYDQPYDQKLDPDWITPAFVEERIWAMGAKGEWKRNQLQVSYLQRKSEELAATTIFSSEDLSRLSERYDFRKATLFQYKRHDSLGAYGRVQVSLRWIHSLESDADMLSIQSEYNYFKNWSWLIGGDIIGTQNEENNDFFSRNRSNDRVYAGMTYVF